MMTAKTARENFIAFFKNKGHTVVPSSPLVPKGDPSLLFNSAGMVPLKPYFLGLKTDISKAASCQKCFRTTDIDRVGATARHLTFFEMLGNFSFGDYFKTESIAWGWEYLIKEAGIDPQRLYVTVYGGGLAPKDEEAAAIWRKVLPDNLKEGHIKMLGDDSNFWTMGPTGPCGPCSEIYFDFGPEGNEHAGCTGVGCDCDRYIEVWNHVFTQFDRREDGTLKLLPRKNIDTGMGLERLAAVVQGKKSPFDTDLFQPIAAQAAEMLKIGATPDKAALTALRIISDHARACSFLACEGIMPSNEGRGYVLRRIIRRAARYGMLYGRREPFLSELTASVTGIFRAAYPEIEKNEKRIKAVIKAEEDRFLETLESGEKQIQNLLEKYPDTLPGAEVFSLYETYGFPLELTREIAVKNGRDIDEGGFNQAKSKAQETAKAGWKGSGQKETFPFQKADMLFAPTRFTGYAGIKTETKILGLIDEGGEVIDSLAPGEHGYVVLEATPFYAESGGQVGDRGTILDAGGNVLAEIEDTQKPVQNVIFHKAKTVAKISKNMQATALVDKQKRQATEANHTAVHLVNAALRKVLGDMVRQAGSYVSDERFRFDYTAASAPTQEQLDAVEQMANDAIRQDFMVCKAEKPLSEAEKLGAVTLLGEKYADPARFILINKTGWDSPQDRFSLELCGGTHAERTGSLATVKIIKESSLSAGVRRIEGVAGASAVEYLRKTSALAEKIARKLAANTDEIEQRIEQLLSKEKMLRQEIQALKQKMLAGNGGGSAEVITAKGRKLAILKTEGLETGMLRAQADKLAEANKDCVCLVAAKREDKISFVIALPADIAGNYDACLIAKTLGDRIGGKGGGRKDFAQGGGKAEYWEKLAELAAESL